MSIQNSVKGITLANAPISYGAFEVTVGIDPNVPDGIHVLDEVASAGYAGIDLGPVGYLGSGQELGKRLADRGLGLAGSYLEFPFADAKALASVIPELDAMLDTFDAVASQVTGPAPRPTIADNGSEFRRAHPGAGIRNPESGQDAATWERFAVGLSAIVDRCSSRGYEPTFHHETGTFVESPAEIEKVLSLSDVGLCLDAGHFQIGGGNPLEFLKKWSSRIDHVHIKDANLAKFENIVKAGEPATAIWSREVFPVLGAGDLDARSFVEGLIESGYQGWLVVEQDILPQTPERFAQAIQDQRTNRAFLAELGI